MVPKIIYIGIGTRALATVVDAVLLAIVGVSFRGTQLYSNPFDQSPTSWLGLAGLNLAYFILLEWLAGGTIGKLAVGIRVVRQDGSRCSLGQVLIRNVLRIVDFLPAFYLLGAVLVLRSPNRQRLGDRLANTAVAKHPVPKGTPPPAPFLMH
jgi:uncharacterized RDD family membrane protein YckC